jgi:hypothetical protein
MKNEQLIVYSRRNGRTSKLQVLNLSTSGRLKRQNRSDDNPNSSGTELQTRDERTAHASITMDERYGGTDAMGTNNAVEE